ncbi:MAG: TonB-dependent receptor [Flavobacteriales bacterium]|nr:TonB-dependent receptor [Flavobacteriales bacterium]
MGAVRLFLFTIAALPSVLSAQVRVQCRAENGAAVPFATVTWWPHGEAITAQTDDRGALTLPADPGRPLVLTVRMMGFSVLEDTLLGAGPHVLRLSPTSINMPELVVTGQYGANMAENAVHRVRVIDRGRLDRMAANSLGDALRNELTVRLGQDNILGTAVSMQGLGGENVKVLVDGVPVIGRQDGNLDLAQLDLTGIERVEVVEGPLSVNYGTNALAGTINLITRKRSNDRASAKATAYAEHIGRLNLTGTATSRLGRHDLVLTGGRNAFAGWDPATGGWYDPTPTLADSTRHQQWKPREQLFARLNHRWRGDRWDLGYKGEVFQDRITNRGRPRAPYHETAFDEQFLTHRLDNAVFVEGRLGQGRRFNALLAPQRYRRIRNTWFRDLTDLSEQLVTTSGTQDTSRFTLTNLRATWASAPDSAWLSWEVGTDLNHETGSGDRMAGDGETISDLAAFASMELRPWSRLTLRPGLRYAFNTRFEAPLIPSLNLRWAATPALTVRAAYARGFRAPSLKELHLYFVDVNHDIVGNPELRPERAHHGSAGLTYRAQQERGTWTAELSAFHNYVEDLISLAQVSGARYTYVNIGSLRTYGGTLGAGWDNGRWAFTTGGSITGRADAVSPAALWSPEARASATWDHRRIGLSASLFYKYQGELANYIADAEGSVTRGTISAYHLADATLTKSFLDRRLGLTVGCKDLFDVRNLAATMAEGAHSAGSNAVPMTTGRTWFLRLDVELRKRS